MSRQLQAGADRGSGSCGRLAGAARAARRRRRLWPRRRGAGAREGEGVREEAGAADEQALLYFSLPPLRRPSLFLSPAAALWPTALLRSDARREGGAVGRGGGGRPTWRVASVRSLPCIYRLGTPNGNFQDSLASPLQA